MIRGSPWSRRALSARRGPRKSPGEAGHELKLAGPSSCSTYCPDCTVPWRRARAAGLSYACAGAGCRRRGSGARGSAAARGCAAAPGTAARSARRGTCQVFRPRRRAWPNSLWRSPALLCASAAPRRAPFAQRCSEPADSKTSPATGVLARAAAAGRAKRPFFLTTRVSSGRARFRGSSNLKNP